MKHHSLTHNLKQLAYNAAVKGAYFKVLKQTKLLISTIERHELRCTYQRSNKVGSFVNTINELINPIIYLSLECNDGEVLSIHFGFEQGVYSEVTTKFLRLLYKLTAKELTPVNIEDCIKTEFVIIDCSALYETIEDGNNKQHTFSLIAYKPTITKRKRMKAVA